MRVDERGLQSGVVWNGDFLLRCKEGHFLVVAQRLHGCTPLHPWSKQLCRVTILPASTFHTTSTNIGKTTSSSQQST